MTFPVITETELLAAEVVEPNVPNADLGKRCMILRWVNNCIGLILALAFWLLNVA